MKSMEHKSESKHKRARDSEESNSIAKRPKTEEQAYMKSMEHKSENLKHKRARDSEESSSITKKKKPKTEEQIHPSREGINNNPLTNIPQDVSFVIFDKLSDPFDHLSFARVCKDWRSLSLNYNEENQQRWLNKGRLLPLFMVPKMEEGNHVLQAYSISNEKVYNNIRLPVTHGNIGGHCCGSSQGWLVMVDIVDHCLSLTLVHPFQNSVAPIRLPHLDFMNLMLRDMKNFREHFRSYITKVILSSDPIANPDSYVVTVLYDYGETKLAFIKGGQDQWTNVDRRQTCLMDAVFYRNQVYAVGGSKEIRLMSFAVASSQNPKKPPRTNRLKLPNVIHRRASKSYLVESTLGDHLWHVRRKQFSFSTKTDTVKETFEVYKLVLDEQSGSVVEHEEVQSIGDEALFVGASCHSISVLASNVSGVKANCIYFITEEKEAYVHPDGKPHHIYSLEDGTFMVYRRRHRDEFQSEIQCRVWCLPMFKELCYP